MIMSMKFHCLHGMPILNKSEDMNVCVCACLCEKEF